MPNPAVFASAYNRPQAREGPHQPYKNEAGSNPVLRGVTLAIISSMYGGQLCLLWFRLTDVPKHRLVQLHSEHLLEIEWLRQAQRGQDTQGI